MFADWSLSLNFTNHVLLSIATQLEKYTKSLFPQSAKNENCIRIRTHGDPCFCFETCFSMNGAFNLVCNLGQLAACDINNSWSRLWVVQLHGLLLCPLSRDLATTRNLLFVVTVALMALVAKRVLCTSRRSSLHFSIEYLYIQHMV